MQSFISVLVLDSGKSEGNVHTNFIELVPVSMVTPLFLEPAIVHYNPTDGKNLVSRNQIFTLKLASAIQSNLPELI